MKFKKGDKFIIELVKPEFVQIEGRPEVHWEINATYDSKPAYITEKIIETMEPYKEDWSGIIEIDELSQGDKFLYNDEIYVVPSTSIEISFLVGVRIRDGEVKAFFPGTKVELIVAREEENPFW